MHNFTTSFTLIVYQSGWPSGLRRQTQVQTFSPIVSENSGPRLRAWVQIPLLTKFLSDFLNEFNKSSFIQQNVSFNLLLGEIILENFNDPLKTGLILESVEDPQSNGSFC